MSELVLDTFGLPLNLISILESKHHLIHGVVWIFSVSQTFLKRLSLSKYLEVWMEKNMDFNND